MTTNNKRPAFRIIAKNRSTGRYFVVGAAWESPFEGVYNVRLVLEPRNEYEMSFSEVLEDPGDFFINLSSTSNRDNGRGAKPKSGPKLPKGKRAAENGDDDL